MNRNNPQNHYDYENRQGILPISWNDFHGLCRAIALKAFSFQPELILAVGRGGYYAGTLLSHVLHADLYPVRLSRRLKDVIMYSSPRWIVEPPATVNALRVLIVDEISSRGETLQIVKDKVQALGVAEVRCAVCSMPIKVVLPCRTTLA